MASGSVVAEANARARALAAALEPVVGSVYFAVQDWMRDHALAPLAGAAR